MSRGLYSIARGDLFLQSKHADVSFVDDAGWALFWFDTPKKGKCLWVEYNIHNWPHVTVNVTANWKAGYHIIQYDEDGWRRESF